MERSKEWAMFSGNVSTHIRTYTIPQYGDYPDDQASAFALEEIQMNLKRYVNRMGTGQRGIAEQKRDMMKIAHYACMAYYKIKEEKNEDCKAVD